MKKNIISIILILIAAILPACAPMPAEQSQTVPTDTDTLRYTFQASDSANLYLENEIVAPGYTQATYVFFEKRELNNVYEQSAVRLSRDDLVYPTVYVYDTYAVIESYPAANYDAPVRSFTYDEESGLDVLSGIFNGVLNSFTVAEMTITGVQHFSPSRVKVPLTAISYDGVAD